MTARYEHLALAEVKPGMVLSDEILDAQGQILLPKGAILNPATIALLPSHGIEMVAVMSSAAALPPPPQRAVVLKRLDKLFRKSDIDEHDDGATTLLRRYVTNYRLGEGEEA